MNGLSVRFVGPVRRPTPERTMTILRSDVQTVLDVLLRVGYSSSESKMVVVLLDGVRSFIDTPINDAKTMDITVLVGGG